jgi:hypothetical protein
MWIKASPWLSRNEWCSDFRVLEFNQRSAGALTSFHSRPACLYDTVHFTIYLVPSLRRVYWLNPITGTTDLDVSQRGVIYLLVHQSTDHYVVFDSRLYIRF